MSHSLHGYSHSPHKLSTGAHSVNIVPYTRGVLFVEKYSFETGPTHTYLQLLWLFRYLFAKHPPFLSSSSCSILDRHFALGANQKAPLHLAMLHSGSPFSQVAFQRKSTPVCGMTLKSALKEDLEGRAKGVARYTGRSATQIDFAVTKKAVEER